MQKPQFFNCSLFELLSMLKFPLEIAYFKQSKGGDLRICI